MRRSRHHEAIKSWELVNLINWFFDLFFVCLWYWIYIYIHEKEIKFKLKKKNRKEKFVSGRNKINKWIINMYRNSIGWCLQLSLVSSLDRLEYWSDDDSSLEKLGWAPPLECSLFNMVLRICWIDIAAGFDWSINILSPSHSLSLYCRTFLCFS